MTYLAGNVIQPADFNTMFLGSGTSQAVAYPNAASTQKKLAALLGVGYGDVGYGQLATPIAPITNAITVNAVDWTNAINKLNSIRNFLGQTLPASPVVPSVGSNIEYLSTLQSMVDAAYDARFSPAPINMALNTVNTAALPLWSTIGVFIVTVTFTSEDHARSFFNTGSEVRLSMTHPADATSQNQNWKSIVETGFGVYSLKANSSSLSGTLASFHTSRGYYQLPQLPAYTLYATDIGSGAYVSNDLNVLVNTVTGGGVNGGNGYAVTLRITLADQHTNTFYDKVIAGLKLTVQAYSPSVVAIPLPTVAITANAS